MARSSSHDVALADLLALERALFAYHARGPNPFDAYPGDVRVAVLQRVRWKRAYRLYLRSDAWAAKRAAVLDRCGHACESCPAGSGLFPVALDIHHVTYDRIGDEDLDDLQGLCRDCHEQVHADRLLAKLR